MRKGRVKVDFLLLLLFLPLFYSPELDLSFFVPSFFSFIYYSFSCASSEREGTRERVSNRFFSVFCCCFSLWASSIFRKKKKRREKKNDCSKKKEKCNTSSGPLEKQRAPEKEEKEGTSGERRGGSRSKRTCAGHSLPLRNKSNKPSCFPFFCSGAFFIFAFFLFRSKRTQKHAMVFPSPRGGRGGGRGTSKRVQKKKEENEKQMPPA